MYGALWRLLPGPAWARAAMLVIAAATLIVVLFEWGFPWIASLLSLQDQTINEGG